MELRKLGRYNISGYVISKYDFKEVCFHVEENENFTGKIVDINLDGMGVEIPMNNAEFKIFFKNSDEFKVELKLYDDTIKVKVSKEWHNMIDNDGNLVIRGGVKFKELTPEDHLILSKFIGQLRNSNTNLAASSKITMPNPPVELL